MASSPEYANAPSPWVSCGDGCEEMVRDWSADPKNGIFAVQGASDGTARYIGYTRDLGDNARELQIVRLPDNEVVFNALTPDSIDKCNIFQSPYQMSSSNAVFRLGQTAPVTQLVDAYLWAVDLASGTDLVWFEGTDYDSVTSTYGEVTLWTAPYTRDPAALEPRLLRIETWQNTVMGGDRVVGGGYALHQLTKDVGDTNERSIVLTRLADGATWSISNRENFVWSQPVYVDSQELAIVENATSFDLGKAGQSYTIVRYQIAALGPPVLP